MRFFYFYRMQNNKIIIQEYYSPFGELLIGSLNNQICLCDWKHRKMRQVIDEKLKKYFNASYIFEESEIVNEAIFQLTEYFQKKLHHFNLPLLFAGTQFQQNVWQQLLKIDYGKTISYLMLAQRINNVSAIRAVASANGANAISIIVPCHRVIGSNNELVGYAGGVDVKRKLLLLENSQQTTLNFTIQ